MRCRFDFCVFGYVIMPEHVHLLVSEPKRGTIADAIHFLKTSVAKRIRSLRWHQPAHFGRRVITIATSATSADFRLTFDTSIAIR